MPSPIAVCYQSLSDACKQAFKGLSNDQKCFFLYHILNQDHIDNSIHCAQGQCQWFHIRSFRITASKAAAYVHKHPYSSAKKYLKKMLQNLKDMYDDDNLVHTPPMTSNEAKWGIEHENEARDFYLKTLQQEYTDATAFEVGLKIMCEEPYIGASPDGYVYLKQKLGTDNDKPIPIPDRLLEIKCPSLRRRTEPYRIIPLHHYIQLQMNMAVHKVPVIDYQVYSPTTTKRSLQQFTFCEDLWNVWLKTMRTQYFMTILPALTNAWMTLVNVEKHPVAMEHYQQAYTYLQEIQRDL